MPERRLPERPRRAIVAFRAAAIVSPTPPAPRAPLANSPPPASLESRAPWRRTARCDRAPARAGGIARTMPAPRRRPRPETDGGSRTRCRCPRRKSWPNSCVETGPRAVVAHVPNLERDAAVARQRAPERHLILNRMRGEDGQHRSGASAPQPASKAGESVAALPAAPDRGRATSRRRRRQNPPCLAGTAAAGRGARRKSHGWQVSTSASEQAPPAAPGAERR